MRGILFTTSGLATLIASLGLAGGCPPSTGFGTDISDNGNVNGTDDSDPNSDDGGGDDSDSDDADDDGGDSDDPDDGTDTGETDDGDDTDDGNSAPTADAGPGQMVQSGELVTLSGSGADSDGDALTFSWSQLNGTAVALSDPAAQETTFIAPDLSETLTFELTVSDGEFSASAQVSIVVDVPPMLFVSRAGGGVVAFRNAPQLSGDAPADTLVDGANTLMNITTDVAVDRDGALLALDFVGGGLLAYDDALTANGDIAPDRQVTGAATGLFSPTSMVYDAEGDRWYCADTNGTRDVFVFDNASGAGFTGDIAPTRTITSGAFNGGQFWRIALRGDSLYMNNPGSTSVLVLDGVAALDGAVAASRTLTNAAFSSVIDVFVDQNDNLFALETDTLHVFENAAGLDGAVVPTRSMTITGAVNLSSIVVDAGGIAYLADSTANAIFVLDDAAARSGAVAPDRTISGAATGLNSPYAVEIFDR